MRDIYDTIEKALLTAVLLGDVAYQIKVEHRDGQGNNLEVDHIEWGFHKSQLTKEVKDLFSVWGFKESDGGYEYEFSGVPVKIRVYERKYPFLTNFDTAYYGVDEFHIPNSFDKYWKIRGMIK